MSLSGRQIKIRKNFKSKFKKIYEQIFFLCWLENLTGITDSEVETYGRIYFKFKHKQQISSDIYQSSQDIFPVSLGITTVLVQISTLLVWISTLSVQISTLSLKIFTLSVKISTLSVKISTFSVKIFTLSIDSLHIFGIVRNMYVVWAILITSFWL